MRGGGNQQKFQTSGAAMRSQGDSGSDRLKDWPPHADRPEVHQPASHAQASGGVSVQQGQPSRYTNSEDASGAGGQVGPSTSANPSTFRNLTPRAVAALAFIAVENAHRRYPRPCEIGRFLNLPHERQTGRVVEELLWKRFVERSERGLKVRIP